MTILLPIDDPRPRKISSAALSDALDQFVMHRATLHDLVSPTPERILFGPAVTLRFLPQREDLYDAAQHNFARLFYEAIGTEDGAGRGRVLVLSSSGHPDISLGGGIKLARAATLGLAGVIADARLRDLSELGGYDLSIWCRGSTPRGGQHSVMPWEANVAVDLAGATVVPGDYVFADRHGAVVIPARHVNAVLDAAVSIEARDQQAALAVRAEDPQRVRREGSQDD